VGSQGKVCKYDANLNLLATAAVPGRVFDLLIGNNGEVVACGEGFVASVDLMPTSSMIITCSAAVPLELLTFTGRSEGTANLLEWRTTAEREGVRFEIERSVGGERFEKVATVEGLGLTGGRYTYTDRLQSGTGELIYYRLRQVNEDHTFGYSATITLSRSGLSLLPDLTGNPVRAGEDIKLRVDRHRSDKLDIMIRNAEGRLVYSGTFSPEQGGEYIFIPSASLSSGIYTLQATSPQSTASRKLVIYR
jgi:hypothetical protein